MKYQLKSSQPSYFFHIENRHTANRNDCPAYLNNKPFCPINGNEDHILECLHHARNMESLGQIASMVAHDLNNTLFAIQGLTELTREKCTGDMEAVSNLDKILNIIENAALLIKQILSFSSKHKVSQESVDLNESIANMWKILDCVTGKSIEVELSADADPATVRVEPGQIQQILLNLCINAREAISEKGRVRIETRRSSGDYREAIGHQENMHGDYLVLTVSDTGNGIPSDVSSRIFEPYFTTKKEGTGLGLSTVYDIVRRHNGHVSVTSEPGQGTSFHVYLPAADRVQ